MRGFTSGKGFFLISSNLNQVDWPRMAGRWCPKECHQHKSGALWMVVINLHPDIGGICMLRGGFWALALFGIVCVFVLASAGWTQVTETLLIESDDNFPYGQFGKAVDVDDARIIVGAQHTWDNGTHSGAAYTFDIHTGEQQYKLLPADGAEYDLFGFAVAIDGDRALVSAYSDDDLGDGSGSVYVFDTNSGQQLLKLIPDDGTTSAHFGADVELVGTTAIIGAQVDGPGAVYIFDITSGQQIRKIVPDDGENGDFFGWSVSASGETLVVGAYRDDDNGGSSGSAYLYDLATGNFLHKLVPDDGNTGDCFGWSVGVYGSLAVIGALNDDDNAQNSGSAYIFEVTSGDQVLKLLPEEAGSNDNFGRSVAIQGTTAIIGVVGYSEPELHVGAAYMYDALTGQQISLLQASDGDEGDSLGESVAATSSVVVVGAHLTFAGSAYVFDMPSIGAMPTDVSVAYGPDGNTVSWDYLSKTLSHFRIYRSDYPDFVPGPDFLVQETPASPWFDAGGNYDHVYMVSAVNSDGSESDPVPPTEISGVGISPPVTMGLLHQNVPNPFNPQTIISFDVLEPTTVRLAVYDASGRMVDVIIDNEMVPPGRVEVPWRGRDSLGRAVSAGVYFYRLEAGEFIWTKSMVLAK